MPKWFVWFVHPKPMLTPSRRLLFPPIKFRNSWNRNNKEHSNNIFFHTLLFYPPLWNGGFFIPFRPSFFHLLLPPFWWFYSGCHRQHSSQVLRSWQKDTELAIPCLHQRQFIPRSTLVQYSFNIERALNGGLTIVVRYRVRLCRCACSSVVRPFLFYIQPMRLVGKSLSTTFLLAFWLWGGRKGMQRNPWRQMWYHASEGYAIWGEVLDWLSAAR